MKLRSLMAIAFSLILTLTMVFLPMATASADEYSTIEEQLSEVLSKNLSEEQLQSFEGVDIKFSSEPSKNSPAIAQQSFSGTSRALVGAFSGISCDCVVGRTNGANPCFNVPPRGTKFFKCI